MPSPITVPKWALMALISESPRCQTPAQLLCETQRQPRTWSFWVLIPSPGGIVVARGKAPDPIPVFWYRCFQVSPPSGFSFHILVLIPFSYLLRISMGRGGCRFGFSVLCASRTQNFVLEPLTAKCFFPPYKWQIFVLFFFFNPRAILFPVLQALCTTR